MSPGCCPVRVPGSPILERLRKVADTDRARELEALETPHPENKRPIPPQWLAYMEQNKKGGKKKAEQDKEQPVV